MGNRDLTVDGPSGQYVQVVVSIRVEDVNHNLCVDPWDNCPSVVAKEEGRLCNECEFWGREVQGIDWYEFSLCLFGTGH